VTTASYTRNSTVLTDVTRGSVQVSAHDRSAPDRGDSDDRGSEPVYLHPGNVAKARQNMQDYLTFFRQNAARDKERGVDNGWQLAVDHLEHFLDGTGTPMALSSEQVARMPALISAEEDARIQLEQTFTANTKNDRLNAVLKGLADGAALELKDFWDTRTSSRHNRPRDYAAIGQSSVHSETAFRVARKADLIMIEGEVTHRLGAKDPDPSKPNH
jgi:hypothetical protein